MRCITSWNGYIFKTRQNKALKKSNYTIHASRRLCIALHPARLNLGAGEKSQRDSRQSVKRGANKQNIATVPKNKPCYKPRIEMVMPYGTITPIAMLKLDVWILP
jgi:hypothetical protein